MSLDKVIESQIQDAIAAGAFDNLAGAGKPLPFTEHEKMAGENWLGFKVLQNGGMVPQWLGLAQDIERAFKRLEQLEAQFTSLVDLCQQTGQWERNELALRHSLARYEEHARDLRRMQDNFNLNAPGIRTERPAIWVEHHLERLRARLAEARGA